MAKLPPLPKLPRWDGPLSHPIYSKVVKRVLDFTGEEAGTNTFKATIRCSEGNETVGAVGTYSVSATVKQKQVP